MFLTITQGWHTSLAVKFYTKLLVDVFRPTTVSNTRTLLPWKTFKFVGQHKNYQKRNQEALPKWVVTRPPLSKLKFSSFWQEMYSEYLTKYKILMGPRGCRSASTDLNHLLLFLHSFRVTEKAWNTRVNRTVMTPSISSLLMQKWPKPWGALTSWSVFIILHNILIQHFRKKQQQTSRDVMCYLIVRGKCSGRSKTIKKQK